MTECPNPSHAMQHRGAGWQYGCDCPSCTAGRAAWLGRARTRAPLAPDCPNPTHQMLWAGAAWSRHCPCPGCVAGRSAHATKIRAAFAARQYADEIAVERAVRGDAPAALNKAERLAVVARLTEAGESARQIAARLRVTPRSVVRYRREISR